VVWDLATRKPRSMRSDALKGPWHGCVLSADARTLALSKNGRNILCDAAAATEKSALSLPQEAAILALSAEGRRLAAASDRTLRVLFLPDGADDNGHLLDERAGITALAFAPGGDLLAVGLQNGHLILWDVPQKSVRWRQGGSGYVFLLLSNFADRKAKPARLASFAAARARGVPFEMRLLRNGVLLHEKSLRLADGPLHLLARRIGDRLELQADRGERLVFHDVMPLPATESSVFGIHWPATAGLTRLRATAQMLPPAASPLERADDLFEKGRYGDALALYQGQFAAGDLAGKQEAQYRAATCLMRLNRSDEAAQLLAALVNAEGERWPLIAACQLWLIRLRQKKFDDLDNLLTIFSAHFNREQLATYVPAHLRQDTVRLTQVGPGDHLLMDPAVLRQAEQALAIARFFEDKDQVFWGRYRLAQLYCSAGHDDKALPLFRQCVQESEATMRTEGLIGYDLIWPLRWYTWLLRRTGAAEEALRIVDRCLFDESGRPRYTRPAGASGAESVEDPRRRDFLALYLERARAHAALSKWDQAENDLDDMARLLPPDTTYQFYAACRLMKGFLCARRGDEAGAKQSWKEGTYPAYLARLPERMRSQAPPLGNPHQKEMLLHHLIMASLSDELSDAEAATIFSALVKMLGDKSLAVQMVQAVKVEPSLLRNTWRSPRGREVGRRIAFLDLSPQEFVRFPMYLAAEQKFKQDLLTGEPNAEMEEQLWQIVSSLAEGIFSGRINKRQAIQISLAYKGTMNVFGWKGVAPTLEPGLRAKLAFLLGLRFSRKKETRDAETLFRTTIADAPADSVLRKLAEAELKRATMKK
jgi:tetratricopeptide (TPR) repeat protein